MEGNKSQLTHSPHLDAAVGTVCVCVLGQGPKPASSAALQGPGRGHLRPQHQSLAIGILKKLPQVLAHSHVRPHL